MLSKIGCCFFFGLLVALFAVNVEGQVSADEMQPIGSNPSGQTCSCGTANRRTRIIGGVETEINEFPWMIEIMVYVKVEGTWMKTKLCGGTLIDRLWIVTAAHCFKDLVAKDLVVAVGDHDLSKSTETVSQNINVSMIVLHPKYDNRTVANDIALLKLVTPAAFSRTVLPACLPPLKFSLRSQIVTITGYGSTEQAGPLSNVLNEVDIPIMPNDACKEKYKGSQTAVIDDSVVCAGTGDGKKDACQGDSGSPAVVKCNNIYTFSGLVSYGVGCGDKDFPGVLTNVSHYRDWIEANAQGASLCVHNCNPTPPQDCGWPYTAKVGKRVVGGTTSQANRYPWMAALYKYSYATNSWDFTCGATIISKDWLLTSARCIEGASASDVFVTLGVNNINTPDETREQELYISQISIHPNYSTNKFGYDVALLKLSTPAVFGDYVGSICLPPSSMNKDFGVVNLNFLGWGRTSTGGAFSGPLKEVVLRTMTNNICEQYPAYSSAVQPSNVCTVSSSSGDVCQGVSPVPWSLCTDKRFRIWNRAWGFSGGVLIFSATEGDSGGPLMTVGSSGRFYLAAVQSFRYSSGCASGYPSGHIRLSYVMEWVTQKTGLTSSPFPDTLPF